LSSFRTRNLWAHKLQRKNACSSRRCVLCTPQCVLLTSLVLLEFFRGVLCMGSFLRLLRLLQLYFYVVSLCFYGCTSLFGRLSSDFVSTLYDRIYDGHLLNMQTVRSLSLSGSWEVNSHMDSSCHSDVKCRAGQVGDNFLPYRDAASVC